MTDIIKYDVRTYVEELINNEFSSKTTMKKSILRTTEQIQVDIAKCSRPPLQSSVMEEQLQT